MTALTDPGRVLHIYCPASSCYRPAKRFWGVLLCDHGTRFVLEAKRMGATASDVEQLIEEYEALWNGDYSKLEVVSDRVAVYDPAAPDGEVHGRDAFEAFLRETRGAFPDFTLRTHEMLVEDDTVMVEWTVTGTLENEFYGAPPSGRTMEIMGMAKTTVKDGQISEDRLYYDQKEMLAQLGFSFPDVLFLAPKLVWGKLTGGAGSTE